MDTLRKEALPPSFLDLLLRSDFGRCDPERVRALARRAVGPEPAPFSLAEGQGHVSARPREWG